MSRVVKSYTLLFAIALIVGETLVVLKIDKFWPLSLDDYLAALALALIVLVKLNHKTAANMLLPVVWGFICGNLYAMLFSRLEPVTGSGERIGLLVVALFAAAVGLLSSLRSSFGSLR